MFDYSNIMINIIAVIAVAVAGGLVVYLRMKNLMNRMAEKHVQAIRRFEDRMARQGIRATLEVGAMEAEIEGLRSQLAEAQRNSLSDDEMAMYRIWRSDADYDFKLSQAKDDAPWPSPEAI